MATYYDIFGQKVQNLSSDISPAATGQVWYNTASYVAKFQGFAPSAWATAPNLPYNTRDASGFGTQTAGVIFGGTNPGYVNTANEYDGSSFTAATAVPQVIGGLDSDGPQTAGLTAGGNTPGDAPLNLSLIHI